MRALVISGGGSKGAFAGGVAQYLMEEEGKSYDMFLGTSTGSLLITHLAANKIETIKQAFTHVTQSSIFDNNPFLIRKKKGTHHIKINHLNVLKNFIKGRKTFGESFNLRRLLANEISASFFEKVKASEKEVIVCVSNLSTNSVEYKSIHDFDYHDFLDWIWISCNYVPFMSLVSKEGCEYADGGLGCIIPIEKAISLGATDIDAIMLDTEFQQTNRVHSSNPFDALGIIFDFISDRISSQNIHIGNLLAKDYNVDLRIFYTPKVLTTQSLVFDQEQMKTWWQLGWDYAKSR